MARQIINNSESGLVVRSKLNDNFTELYTGKDSVTVATFALLPDPTTVSGQKWWVLTSTGVWLVSRKQAGSYYSDGVAWTWLGDNPTTADQVGNVPAGAIAATNVQAALNELDAEKQPLAAVLTATTASFTSAQETKLAGVAAGATANNTNLFLLDRTNHTGTQAVGTITGLGTLATQSGTFSGASSGNNSGDQASIVGITGTKAQFDAAVTDGDFLFVGNVTQYTDEMAQDAVGIMVDASLVYNDLTPSLQRAALTGAITVPIGSNATALGSFTTAQINAALSDNDIATGGGTATGSNSGDQSTITGNAGSATTLSIGADRTKLDGIAAGATANSTDAFLRDRANHTGTQGIATILAVATNRFFGRIAALGGAGEELTGTQATTLLDNFTALLKGLVPLSGGGTVNFLRADGTWAAPPAGGGGVTDGDKGDITVTATGATWTIDASVVTLAKQADVATGSVFYRKTALTGAPEVQTLATLKTDLGLAGTNNGDQTITLTSDVTGTGAGSFVTTIAAGVVTNAKLANVNTATFKGRVSALAGAPEDLTGTQATTLLDIATTALKGLLSTADKTKLDGIAPAAQTGTVTSASVTTANGVSGAVATATTTPAITITLGAITPTSVAATGAITSSGAAVGYATGAGGAVTQLTSKATGVTLSKPTGAITLVNAALAAATSVAFTLTNTFITVTDVVVVNIKSGAASTIAYQATVQAVAAGSCVIALRNVSAGALSEAVVLQFAVIKGVNA